MRKPDGSMYQESIVPVFSHFSSIAATSFANSHQRRPDRAATSPRSARGAGRTPPRPHPVVSPAQRSRPRQLLRRAPRRPREPAAASEDDSRPPARDCYCARPNGSGVSAEHAKPCTRLVHAARRVDRRPESGLGTGGTEALHSRQRAPGRWPCRTDHSR
jgi:hypothetical protein